MEKNVFVGKWYKKTKTYTSFRDRADGNGDSLVGKKGGGNNGVWVLEKNEFYSEKTGKTYSL